jgi:Arc/MetJ family transcription regulator
MYKVVVSSIHPDREDLTMSVTPIDLDEEALVAAMAELGTSTKKDTVNTALREIAARNSRQRALERLLQLGDPEAGLQAWRARKGLDLSGAEAQ